VSAEQVELLREMYSRRTLEEFAESLHPDAELHQASEVPDTDTYYGREEFVRGVRRWLEEWESFRYFTGDAVDLGDGVLLRVHLVGRGKESGVKLKQDIFHLWKFRDGKPFRCDVIWQERDARLAAGLEPD
jgi:ketosteroid isomerase-like protein